MELELISRQEVDRAIASIEEARKHLMLEPSRAEIILELALAQLREARNEEAAHEFDRP